MAAPAAHALLVGAAVEAARDLRPLADAVRLYELHELRVLVGRPLVALDARVDLLFEGEEGAQRVVTGALLVKTTALVE